LAFTGNLANQDGANATIYPSFNFQQSGQSKDIYNINLNFNYYFTGQAEDLNNIDLNFSGRLNKFPKDSENVSLIFNEINYKPGAYTHIINTDDETQITFGISRINYSDSAHGK